MCSNSLINVIQVICINLNLFTKLVLIINTYFTVNNLLSLTLKILNLTPESSQPWL